MDLLFFSPSVTGEYDLRKEGTKRRRRNPLLNEIMVLTLPILFFSLSLSLAYIEKLINIENTEKTEYYALRWVGR